VAVVAMRQLLWRCPLQRQRTGVIGPEGAPGTALNGQ